MMLEQMMFPDTVEEFMDDYKIVDTDEVYTNGAALVPIFRMNQWFNHKKGKWIPIKKGEKGYSAGDFRCSVCGNPNKCYSLTPYCCNCGADMREEKNP